MRTVEAQNVSAGTVVALSPIGDNIEVSYASVSADGTTCYLRVFSGIPGRQEIIARPACELLVLRRPAHVCECGHVLENCERECEFPDYVERAYYNES